MSIKQGLDVYSQVSLLLNLRSATISYLRRTTSFNLYITTTTQVVWSKWRHQNQQGRHGQNWVLHTRLQ
jgi:hypothetical protein